MSTLRALGLELSADDIYSEDNPSLYKAVVNVGWAGTGSVVSEQGLVLTNHHVVYDHLQKISTLDQDYLTDGFWATSLNNEIPLPGMTVTFLKKIIDVTAQVEESRTAWIREKGDTPSLRQLSRSITREYTDGTHYQADINHFFSGSMYLMFVYETFEDVRLVGAPPSSIGKFGGDTDNFIWPRHTGDFSFIRIYANAQNEPSGFQDSNIPYRPEVVLEMDTQGIREGDFAMTLGYPGSTSRYISSYEVAEMLNYSLPARIISREKRLAILQQAMLRDEAVRLNYAASFFNSSNGLKLAQGEYEQLTINNTIKQRQQQEARFLSWIVRDPAQRGEYSQALPLLRQAIHGRQQTLFAHSMLNEALLMGTEIYLAGIRTNIFSRIFDSENFSEKSLNQAVGRIRNTQKKFYAEYHPQTDRQVVIAMMNVVRDQLDPQYLPEIFHHVEEAFEGDIEAFVNHMFENSFLASSERFMTFLDNPTPEALANDPGVRYAVSIYNKAIELKDINNSFREQYNQGQKLLVNGLRQMRSYPLYPDANFTMRMSYGTVKGYSPKDAVYYKHYTTLSGVFEKEDPDHHEFVVHEKLRTLYQKKDFGSYGNDDKMPLAFITNNDITGGNSGSPVLNRKGQLTGVVFCGSWESLSASVVYLEPRNRAIHADVRYILFITDKFGGSSHILDELKLAQQ